MLNRFQRHPVHKPNVVPAQVTVPNPFAQKDERHHWEPIYSRGNSVLAWRPARPKAAP